MLLLRDDNGYVQSSSRCVPEKAKRNFVGGLLSSLFRSLSFFLSFFFFLKSDCHSDEFRDYLNGLGGNNVNFADEVFFFYEAPPRDCTDP